MGASCDWLNAGRLLGGLVPPIFILGAFMDQVGGWIVIFVSVLAFYALFSDF
jgi:hypothetical protein